MLRSAVNQYIDEARAFMEERGFCLPPYAHWSPEDWEGHPEQLAVARKLGLGWDLSDYGSGDFLTRGLLLFTLRNGLIHEEGSRPYAEKIMIVREQQETPYHFHWNKMEDIINRGGAKLMVQVYQASPEEALDMEAPVRVDVDGLEYAVEAGAIICLEEGQSIRLKPYQYHRFWAEGGSCLVGEVSMVNDDCRDNRFLEELPRFSEIEEDEACRYHLCNAYPESGAGR